MPFQVSFILPAQMQGPPPSAAGPSSAPKTFHTDAHTSLGKGSKSQAAPKSVQGVLHQDNATAFVYQNPLGDPSQSSPYYSIPPRPESSSQTTGYTYYNYASNAWGNAWAYPYGAGAYSYPYGPAQNAPQVSAQTHAYPPHPPNLIQPLTKKPPSPSPTPQPEYHKEWDAIIKRFLQSIGFNEAFRGFEADMIVLNPEWEHQKIPAALGELMKDLLVCRYVLATSQIPDFTCRALDNP